MNQMQKVLRIIIKRNGIFKSNKAMFSKNSILILMHLVTKINYITVVIANSIF